ncbi:hypothetical protein SAMN05443575_0884 [Jatrophihabitans endophyticus]|uniref:Uncharacterized protein n=1 Tax=Jatrophihabitans endophyticus TaxID=1206085 RepID=A0A1M5EGC5_9ACTN|nr:hypothetical protein SAMN05443575_0884 [Jatrophihabitans endophyticus]
MTVSETTSDPRDFATELADAASPAPGRGG